ncbi:sialate O-acetylesterase [Aestuariibacter sp. GS-14]|uniref:sialate O-acetylesterase n=1 Tax=Aestuariibacter sp. GS-14 TaxID=2590670 RepID=UPI0015E83685|nr:sialate O-acetylesterase [Aestuariibacter sp. GS-14]
MKYLKLSTVIALFSLLNACSVQYGQDRQQMDIYILMGQSNMVGRDTATLSLQVDDNRILALNEQDFWQVARDPIHKKTGRTEPGIGPGIPFARTMLDLGNSAPIGLVPTAVGGSSLRRWVKGGGLYVAALERIRQAGKHGRIKGVLWHQGESDSDKQINAETHGTRLTGMFKDLRADLGMPELPIVVGEMGYFLEPEKFPFASEVRNALRTAAEALQCVKFVDAKGLDHKGDQLHFSASSTVELGERFARAMFTMQCGE